MTVKDGMQRFSISLSDPTVKMLDRIVEADDKRPERTTHATRSQIITQLIGRDPRNVTGDDMSKQRLDMLNAPIKGLANADDYKRQVALRQIAERCDSDTAQALAGLLLAARNEQGFGEKPTIF